MVSTILIAIGASIVWGVYVLASGLRRNILKARKTGVPYFVVRKFSLLQSLKHQACPPAYDPLQQFTHIARYGRLPARYGFPSSSRCPSLGGMIGCCKRLLLLPAYQVVASLF
jgi:hypothetical protein